MKKLVIFMLITVIVLAFPVNAYAGTVDEDGLTRLFKEHGAVMLLVDEQTGDILFANEAAVTFYGYSKPDIENMNIKQINTLSPSETEAEMRASVKEERNFYVIKHRLANGEIRDVEVFSYPVDYMGKASLFLIVHDVTEKTLLAQHEKDMWTAIIIASCIVIIVLVMLLIILTASHRKLRKTNVEIENINEIRRTFFDADDNIVYLKDENLKYVFVNKAFELSYGKQRDEVIGINDFELSDETFAKLRRQTDKAVVEKHERIVDEITWDARFYQTVKFPVKMPNGEYGVGAYVRDITEQRQHEIRQGKELERNKILIDIISKSFSNRQEQLDYVLQEALKLSESKIGYIYLYDEVSQEFTLNSWSKDVMKECAIVEKQTKYQLENTGVWGEVVRQRKPIVINDFQKKKELKKGYPAGHVTLHNFMSVPVIIDEQIVAVIGLANKADDYDDMDIYELTLLMNGAWNALERKSAQDKLVMERNKYWQTIISIGDGVMVVDRQGCIEMLNSVAQALTGWTQEEAVGRVYQDVFLLAHENENEKIADPIQTVFETDLVHEMGNYAVLKSRDGKQYNLEDSAAPIKDDNGLTVGVVLVFRDVTYKKEQKNRIEYLSYHDALTGLYNRRFFEESLRRLDNQRNLPISIIMGDVNGLKLTNDIFGHAFGDALLQKVSDVFIKTCRSDDIIARWGGDEFVVLLPKTSQEEAKNITNRIKEGFSRVRIKAIKGSISLGYHTKTTAQEDLMETLDKAEGDMYISKTVDRETVKGDAIKEIIAQIHNNRPEEKGHAERVGALCYKMGKLLRLSEGDVVKLKFGGMLHDIGKISLLPGTEGATKTELNDKREHATLGYRILHSFDDTMDLAEAALYHHEQWDGLGYPKGLKGQEIPLTARVVSVADNYDKLRYPASGNEAKTVEEALKIIQDNAGKKFDSQLVSLFAIMVKADEGSR